jgi:hypothetical protein
MLTNRFTAIEANAISLEANKWLDEVDAIIEQNVLSGNTEVRISLCNHSPKGNTYNELGNLWYKAPEFFTSHYNNRKFEIKQDGQCSIIIKWKKLD